MFSGYVKVVDEVFFYGLRDGEEFPGQHGADLILDYGRRFYGLPALIRRRMDCDERGLPRKKAGHRGIVRVRKELTLYDVDFVLRYYPPQPSQE